ncbi:hypothetical protein [Coleofasciculus sp. FACHB-T130]|uniref:hypothetical protein n=1 Tax=Cyanophyceae TaxID=3028117 RepID=UPI0016869BE0|nr:hypothetical protein [Coleofasciculus sp. FACHB-T130]MBD1881407.1 hypothetical protein [Coleofasciculus sp. FACHB-T130]
MNLLWMERLGDWNPQFLRELKGQLKTRKLAIAISVSLISQFLLVLYFYEQLNLDGTYSSFCVRTSNYNCRLDAAGEIVIDWQQWWQTLFSILNWTLPLILLLAGVYMILSDLGKEERRGTLNFIRLSPQSSQSILTGKILGVPILLYLGVALALPLHCWSAISAGVPFYFLVSFYLLSGVSYYFFYSAALLYGFLSEFQASSASFLTFVFALPWLNVINWSVSLVTQANYDWSDSVLYYWQWFYIPLGSNFLLAETFAILTFSLWTYWIWQALNRRFANANATLISKKQSYWMVAYFEFLLLGFCLQKNHLNPAQFAESGFLWGLLVFMETVNLLWFLGLIAALSPHRQALQDWARYRREKVSNRKSFWKSDLMQDLLWGEKSPSLVAVAVNLGIKTVIWGAWILFWPQNSGKISAILGLILSLNWILILAGIAQMLLFMKTAKRSLWAGITVIALIAFPPIFFSVLSMPFYQSSGVWLLTAFPWIGVKEASTIPIFLTILGQWSVTTLLSLQLTRQMRLAGASSSKAIFANRPSAPAR